MSYSLPLPHDAAVSGFGFEIGERRVEGEVDRRRAARQRYERALEEGRSAALLEQERGSLFSQEVGNIPPGAEVVVTVTLDQKLRWLDEGAWEWRFPTVCGPRYLGAAGRVKDAARIAQEVSAEGVTARAELELSLRDRLARGRRPDSPSHAIRASEAFGAFRVGLEGDASLDRDLVVRWAVAELAAGAFLDAGRPDVGFGEDAERAAERLLRRTDAPLVVDLELSGDALLAHAPRALPDLYAGAPACISVALRPEGGFLLVRGRTASGDWETRLRVPALAPGEGSQAGAEGSLRISLRTFAAQVDTEAVLQETLLRVWQLAPAHAPDGRPNSLLRLAARIARNLCIDERRRRRVEPTPPEALERAAEEPLAALAAPADPLLRALLEACREALSGKPAEAFTSRLASAGAESDEVLAERLGMRTNTFLQNFTRARKQLAECLEKKGVDLEAEMA